MKPSPIFWAVTQGNSKCRVRGDTYADALLRAKQFGFANPDSVVRESAQTVKVAAIEAELEKTYSPGITKRVVGRKE